METAVAKTVSALVFVQRCSGGHCARIPDHISFFYVIVFSIRICRKIIVAVTGKPEQLCIFIKAVTTAGIGDQAEKVLRSQIIDPWKRSVRGCDHILLFFVVKETEFHWKSSLVKD